MASSAVPAAVDALLGLVRGAFAGQAVRVDDGPPITDLDEPDAIGVGVSVETGAPGTAHRGFHVGSTDESFGLTCVAQSWSGDTELATRRTRVFELLDTVDTVLEQTPDLGLPGRVIDARIESWDYRPIQDGRGCLALVEFTVRINTYR